MAPSASSASQVNHKPLSIQQAGCRLERTLLGPPTMHTEYTHTNKRMATTRAGRRWTGVHIHRPGPEIMVNSRPRSAAIFLIRWNVKRSYEVHFIPVKFGTSSIASRKSVAVTPSMPNQYGQKSKVVAAATWQPLTTLECASVGHSL